MPAQHQLSGTGQATRKQVTSMNSSTETELTEMTARLRRILLELARREDDIANSEAAASS